ncbi:MAG: outer membrane beta-barrel domain-containing protein [Nannocystaceae bacterium]|nr:outer membrane beta-barrel domain-containing protein [Nannocystaceae bacterium]
MRRILTGPTLALAVLWTLPATASADALAAGPAAGEDEPVVVVDDEMEGGETPTGEKPAGDGTEPGTDVADVIGGDEAVIQKGDESGKQDKNSEENQIKAEIGQITVIQRQRMLKKKRFELMPQIGISVNDPYVRHYTFGLDLNYWFHNRMAVGLTGTGLVGARTPRYENIRKQEGLLLTANKVLWQASVNFTYNPFYGKIAIFNRALLHWEGSITVGGGATQTQVLPRYEALHDPFRTVTGGGQFGVNGRFYTRRVDWLSVNAGVRTWIYADKQEPINRGPDDRPPDGVDNPAFDDPDAAKKAADFKAAFNVVFYLGVSFYLPPKFQYTTPR